jgi:hypothetical protein
MGNWRLIMAHRNPIVQSIRMPPGNGVSIKAPAYVVMDLDVKQKPYELADRQY